MCVQAACSLVPRPHHFVQQSFTWERDWSYSMHASALNLSRTMKHSLLQGLTAPIVMSPCLNLIFLISFSAVSNGTSSMSIEERVQKIQSQKFTHQNHETWLTSWVRSSICHADVINLLHTLIITSILAVSNSTTPMSIDHRIQEVWSHKVTHVRQNHKTCLTSRAYSSKSDRDITHHVRIFRKYRNRSLTWCKSGLDTTLCSWATGTWILPILEASSLTQFSQHSHMTMVAVNSSHDGCVDSWTPEIYISWRIGLLHKHRWCQNLLSDTVLSLYDTALSVYDRHTTPIIITQWCLSQQSGWCKVGYVSQWSLVW